MTVADREAPGAPPARRGGSGPVARSGPLVDPGAELEARLAALVALAVSHGATERPMLASATVAAPSVDPIALFEAARALGLPARCWIQGSARLAFVAIDEAWAVEPTGSDRFSATAAAWEALVAGACVDDASGPTRGTGPLLVGGFAFDEGGGRDETWTGFGAGSLVLPRLLWTEADGVAWLTANDVAGAPSSDGPGRLWARMLDAVGTGSPDAGMAGGRAGAAAGSSDAGTASGSGDPPMLSIVGGMPSEETWRTVAGRFAGAVGRGRVDKVVLARRVDLEADRAVDVAATLRRLVASAAESTVFAIARGDAVFLGATPERLVRTAGRDATTAAIAGSAPRGADVSEDDALAAGLLASEKEREEHAVVVRMLRDSLAPLCDALEIAPSPRVIRLRTVQHLCTDFTARLSDRSGILSLVGVLHPTPAVGGQPRGTALDLIRDQEGIDRGWYAAPLGWVDRDGDGEFVVALRSGVVRGHRAALFAGCGIVADSDPGREWDESRMKLRALGMALGRVEL